MQTQEDDVVRPRRGPRVATVAVGLWTLVICSLVILGADLMWVVAVGDAIRSTGSVPDGVPGLVAPQTEWHNPVVLAEVLLSWVNSLGGSALAAFHVLVVAASLLVVVGDGRRAGGRELRLALAVSLLVVGASATLVVARFPTLSLLPFVVLVALLREWDRGRERAIWWVPPLMVLWGNLHGAVLVGIAVLGVFTLAAGRRGVVTRIVVGLLSLLAFLLTSAWTGTPLYYVSALRNEAAARGTDLWARPDLTKPLDVLLVVAALALVALAARSLRRWEWLVAVGLALGTLSAARHGVWLLLFVAPIAAVPVRARVGEPMPRVRPTRAVRLSGAATAVVVLVTGGVLLSGRGDAVRPPGEDLVAPLRQAAGTGVVLAVEPAAETFVQQGVRVWVANPIDAFDRRTQAAFLDFLHDCAIPAGDFAAIVVEKRCAGTLPGERFTVLLERDGLVVLRPARPA